MKNYKDLEIQNSKFKIQITNFKSQISDLLNMLKIGKDQLATIILQHATLKKFCNPLKLKKNYKYLLFIMLPFIFSCKQNYYPKPHGYIRTDFPQKEYKLFDSVFPYIFEIPVYSKIDPDSSRGTEKYWSDWNFPKFNATVFISYKEIKNNLNEYEEDTRELVYKHTIKADNIEPIIWNNKDENVYGILYDIKGNVASQVQFYLTDSVRHFVRGSFYFNCVPNKDSLSPSLKFIRKDIDRMIETFQWKKNL